MLLTHALVVGYAMACGHVQRDVAERMAALALQESGFETTAIHHNRNGTDDLGLYQTNSIHLARLGQTRQSIMDPCESSRAAASWFKFLSNYNTGNDRDGIMNGYVQGVVSKEHVLNGRLLDIKAAARPPPITSATTRQSIGAQAESRPSVSLDDQLLTMTKRKR